MLPTPKKQTILAVLIPAIVSIIPASLSYCQSVYEIQQKYAKSSREAEAGYAALVTSVKELQEATKVHHDQIIQIQAYLQALETFVTKNIRVERQSTRTGPRNAASQDPSAALARIRPEAPPAPALTEPAASLDQAAKNTP